MGVHRFDRIDAATNVWSRFRGLMGRRDLSAVRLWFPRCASIHTCFMRSAIDVVFLDGEQRVVALHPKVGPWRFIGAQTAESTLELPPGGIEALSIRVGDRLEWPCD